jgi:hypothetical protein
MTNVKSVVSVSRILCASVLVALIALAIWHFNTTPTSAQSVGGFEGALLTITPDSGQTFAVTALTPGPFSARGTITTALNPGCLVCPPGTTGCTDGVFYRTGTVLAGGVAVVQDVYVLPCFNGAIMAVGVLNPDLKGAIEQANLTAVTGGVGTFRGAQGEMQITTNGDGSLTARLIEVPRRSGDDRVRGFPRF